MESELDRLRRKRDQAWEMAGLARQDGDEKAVAKHHQEAAEFTKQIKELLDNQ